MQPFAAVGAVGGHDAVERRFEQDVADFVDDFVRHVGRHFEHDRPVLVLPAAEVEQRIEYLEYVRARMGGTFAAGVVAADVHREIVRILVEVAEEPEVIRGRIFGGRHGVLADVAAHDEPFVRAAQVADRLVQSAVGEPDAVDDGAVFGQPEHARARVACLRARGDGAYLDEPEPERRQFTVGLAVAVEARGQADGIGEFYTEDLAFERRVPYGVTFAQEPPAAGYEPDDAQ